MKRYERKTALSEPSLLTSLLNTPIENIFCNERFCFYLAKSGHLYSTGFDYRVVSKEELYGIPRMLSVQGRVLNVSVGKDHALMLTD